MLLSEHNICYYLLNKGMLDTATIVDGEYSARRSDSRNNNFIINKEFDHHNYFIKQIRSNEPEKIETLHTEARCYNLANTDPRYKPLSKFLPRFYSFDSQQHILILEEIKRSVSLNEYFLSNPTYHESIPGKIAELLASYHVSMNSIVNENTSISNFRRQTPWIFTLPHGNPAQWMGAPQSAEHQAMQIIYKNPELLQLITQQEKRWQPTSLIHNDVKFANFLVNTDHKTKGIEFIKLIDWELADIGDPLWDAAAVFQNYLLLWLTTDIPKTQQYPGFRQISLDEVKPMIRACWKEYARLMKFDNKQHEALEKTVGFCAVKLIHSCFEFTPHSPTLQPLSVRLLQVGLNILRSPAQAITQLFEFR